MIADAELVAEIEDETGYTDARLSIEGVGRGILRQECRNQVSALPEKAREAITLVWLRGLKMAEAGRVLHITRSAVFARLRVGELMLYSALATNVVRYW